MVIYRAQLGGAGEGEGRGRGVAHAYTYTHTRTHTHTHTRTHTHIQETGTLCCTHQTQAVLEPNMKVLQSMGRCSVNEASTRGSGDMITRKEGQFSHSLLPSPLVQERTGVESSFKGRAFYLRH